jgi:DNA invertase Pin-like site-specific DNA recombinase
MEKRAVIYTRVSDPSQIENNSLETQEISCKKSAESQGYTIVKIFREEGVSAKHVQTRPQLKELLSFCSKKSNRISVVYVYKFDRFSRNMEEGLAAISVLAKYDISVLSIMEKTDDSAMGRAMRNIMLTLGQLDNELKGERVKDNMQAVFRKGLWPFKVPVGYKRKYNTKEQNKGIPPLQDPNLAPIITKMFQDAATGIYGKSQLAKMMNLQGFADHYRVKADHKIVKEILEKGFYYGRMYAPKWDEHVVGLHEPLIDEETWQRAYQCLILKKKGYHHQDSDLYPLKGVLQCEYCNHVMTSSPSRGRNGIVHYYECKYKGCGKLRINAEKAHEYFKDLLTKIQPTDRVIKLFEHMVFSEWDTMIDQSKKTADKIDQKIVKLKEELVSIRKAKDDKIYTLEQAREEADRVQQDIVVLGIEKSEIRIEQYNTELVREFTEKFLRNLVFLWENLDLSKRQAFLQKVFLGQILCTKDKNIRTIELSPSFKLLQALSDQNGEKVPISIPNPNQLINDVIGLYNTFFPSFTQPAYAYA